MRVRLYREGLFVADFKNVESFEHNMNGYLVIRVGEHEFKYKRYDDFDQVEVEI